MTLVLVLALAFTSSYAATVWKWVDKSGVVHYSDQPVPGAVQFDLSVQTYDAEQAAIAPRSTDKKSAKTDAANAYDRIEIWKPTKEQTFTGTSGQVSVSVRVEPGVQKGHSVRVEMDGQRISQPDAATLDIELKDIPRGAHTLSASVVTRDGQTLIQSTPVTFFMQQPSVIKPPITRQRPN